MNGYRPESKRTRQRKIAAEVSRLIAEACSSVVSNNDRASATSNSGCIAGMFIGDGSSNCTVEGAAVGEEIEASEKMETSAVAAHSTSCIEADCISASLATDLSNNDFPESNEWVARDIDNSDDDDHSSDEDDSKLGIRNRLADWSVRHDVSRNALTELLQLLHPLLPELPKDSRTLLCTQRVIEISTVAGGEYYYFGLTGWLSKLVNRLPGNHGIKHLTVHINIDGIPLFSSSTTSLWPILGSVKEVEDSIFPVAVYCSKDKPKPIEDYLSDFVAEMKQLHENGLVVNNALSSGSTKYIVKLGAVICDAPARAFIKCIKGHNGYHCCERCVQRGEWCSKIILPDLFAPLRTDDAFSNRDDEAHHTGSSPFLQLPCGLITCFPLDYMHLICLGVVRRIIHLWIHGPPSCKLSQSIICTISEQLLVMQKHIPKEFSRKPRSLSEYKLWKATELRLFLLYTGPVALKGLLSPDVYTNFLDLSVAVRLLLSPTLLDHYINYVQELLRYFVDTFAEIYGQDQLVYNVHSVIHLADDARKFGVLDNVSSFMYESYLGRLKKLVHRPQAPCAQIVRRIFEGSNWLTKRELKKDFTKKSFSKNHVNGPVPLSLSHCWQFKQYCVKDCIITIENGDNCVEMNGKIGLIRNILQDRTVADEYHPGYIMFEEFSCVEPFYSTPVDSQQLNVFFVSKMSGINSVHPLSDVTTKYVKLPYKNGVVVCPQIHFQ